MAKWLATSEKWTSLRNYIKCIFHIISTLLHKYRIEGMKSNICILHFEVENLRG